MSAWSLQRVCLFAILISLIVQPARSQSVVASQSEIANFLGETGGVLVFADAANGLKLKVLDLGDAAQNIRTLDNGECRDPRISLDGTRVVYRDVPSGKLYARFIESGDRVHIADMGTTGQGVGYWYSEDGSEFIIYCDGTTKYGYDQGNTYKQKIKDGIVPDGNRVQIYDKAYDGGITPDGVWMGESYGEVHAYNLSTGIEHSTFYKANGNAEGQSCNASMAPHNAPYRMTTLVLPHAYFRTWQYDPGGSRWNELRTFVVPNGATEWGTPEWSLHPDYITVTLNESETGLYIQDATNANRRIKVIDGTVVNSHLFVGEAIVPDPPALDRLEISPSSTSIAASATAMFSASAFDQYDSPFAVNLQWAVVGGGSMSPSNSGGVVTAHSSTFTSNGTEGTFQVTVTGNTLHANANVTVEPRAAVELAVNCGLNSFDVEGWERDDAYVLSGDDWENPDSVDVAGVAFAAPVDVYRSIRHNSPNFVLPQVPNGGYLLRLHFADKFSERLINVEVNGRLFLQDYDIASDAGGQNKAVTKHALVMANGGAGLDIAVFSATGDAFIAGFELIEGVFVDDSPPSIAIASPIDNTTLESLNPVALGIAHDNWAVAEIEVQIDDGDWLMATGSSAWSIELDLSQLAFGTHTLNARARDHAGNSDMARLSFVLVDGNPPDSGLPDRGLPDSGMAADAASPDRQALDGRPIDTALSDSNTVLDSGDSGGLVLPAITILEPSAGQVWATGSVQHIRWQTSLIDDVVLRYSIDNGANYIEISPSVDVRSDFWGDYEWLVPDTPCSACVVMIEGYFSEALAISSPFVIGDFSTVDQDAGSNKKDAEQDQDDDTNFGWGCACSTQPSPLLPLWTLGMVLALFIRRRVEAAGDGLVRFR